MMEPKRRIARAIEEIGPSVTTDCVVTTEVDAQKWTGRLHAILEGGDGGVVGEVVDFVVDGLRGGVGIDVAAETAWVVTEAGGEGV